MIDGFNEYSKSESIDLTTDKILNRKFRTKSQVKNFLIDKKDEIFNLRFKHTFSRFDVSRDIESQQLNNFSKRLAEDSLE